MGTEFQIQNKLFVIKCSKAYSSDAMKIFEEDVRIALAQDVKILTLPADVSLEMLVL